MRAETLWCTKRCVLGDWTDGLGCTWFELVLGLLVLLLGEQLLLQQAAGCMSMRFVGMNYYDCSTQL
jgi:hypothetical protein